MIRGHFASVVLFLAIATLSSFAQVRAGLHGRVLDPSGAAVGAADVELTEATTNIHRQTTSSASGDYVFGDLNPGEYHVAVAASGFQKLSLSHVYLAVGQTASVDFDLKVGNDQQSLTVSDAPPAIQSQTSNIQTNIPEKAVVAMPLNSRNFVQLATLAPGVALPPGTVLPRINGGRPRTNEYLYDGISALQPEPGQVVFFPIIDDSTLR